MASEAPATGHGPNQYQIQIDDQHFAVTQSTLTGAQLKALAGKDPQYQLFLEQHGNDPDKLIGDSELVSMKNGLHFYTVPPASFGAVVRGTG
jgi:hypothetical protein